MNEKLLQQAMALFDTQEKWDAFLELCDSKNMICDKWRNACMERIRQLFYSHDTNRWRFENDKWVLRIFPSQLSNDHHMDIRINLWDMRGYLCIHIDKYDSAAAREMIQNNPKIMPLLDGFGYYNEWDIYSKPFAGDICESSRDSSYYLWGHETERVAEAIFETYMHPFMTDEIADFFVQVCNKTKKDKQ